MRKAFTGDQQNAFVALIYKDSDLRCNFFLS